MAKFLVFSIALQEGIGKKSLKPYKMLKLGGLLEHDDGAKEPAKINLFGSDDRPLPDIKENERYDIVSRYSVDFKTMEVSTRIQTLIKTK